MKPVTCQRQWHRFLLLASPSPLTNDADNAAFSRMWMPTTHLALAWSLQHMTMLPMRNDAAHTIACAVSSLISSPVSSSAPSTGDTNNATFLQMTTTTTHLTLAWSLHTRRRQRGTTQHMQLSLRHLSSCPCPQLTLTGLTSPQYPRVYPPQVSVRVPCGLPACLPAPATMGAGKWRVRVQLSLQTPGGIPVLLPRR